MLISREKYKKMRKKVHEQYCNVLFMDKQGQHNQNQPNIQKLELIQNRTS